MLGLFLLIAIGLVVGALASHFTHGGRLGMTGNLIVGLAGSLLGGVLFQEFGPSYVGGTPGTLVAFPVALVVAIVFVIVAYLIKK